MICITAPTSYFVYSSFAFFGARAGQELPGTWFVRALECVGRAPDVVRMELHRMVADGELLRRRDGRRNFYRPTPVAQAELEAGTRRLFASKVEDWNDRWTVVVAQFTTMERSKRDRLRSLLNVEGFAILGNGVSIHPRPVSPGLERALADMKLQRAVTVFTDARLVLGAVALSDLWGLKDLNHAYARFISRYARRRVDVANADAFALRFAVVFDFLEVAWRDPNLPGRLLPPGWQGHRAQQLASDLYRKLLPGAIAHADTLLAASRD